MKAALSDEEQARLKVFQCKTFVTAYLDSPTDFYYIL